MHTGKVLLRPALPVDEHDIFILDVIDSWDKLEPLMLDTFKQRFNSEIRNTERDVDDH